MTPAPAFALGALAYTSVGSASVSYFAVTSISTAGSSGTARFGSGASTELTESTESAA